MKRPAEPVPDAYAYAYEERADGSRWAVYELLRAAVAETGFGVDSDGRLLESDLAGRGAMAELRLEDVRLVVRRFRRGGLMRYLRAGFSDPRRPFRELALSDRLIALGLPTPRVAFARSRPRSGGAGWDLDLGTVRVEGALDLALWLEQVRGGSVRRAERAAVVRAAGRLVARLHEVGVAHADLTPRNLLLTEARRSEDPPELWVIDLDKSRMVTRLGEAARARNVRRLWRAVARRERRGRPFLHRTDRARFLIASMGASGGDWKRRWRAIARAESRAAPAHAIGWALERLTGRGPEDRDGAARVEP